MGVFDLKKAGLIWVGFFTFAAGSVADGPPPTSSGPPQLPSAAPSRARPEARASTWADGAPCRFCPVPSVSRHTDLPQQAAVPGRPRRRRVLGLFHDQRTFVFQSGSKPLPWAAMPFITIPSLAGRSLLKMPGIDSGPRACHPGSENQKRPGKG